MTTELLRFDAIRLAHALQHCEGKFAAAAALSAAERSWPFLEKYLKYIQADGLRNFRDLLDASWRAAADDTAGQAQAGKLLTFVDRLIPDEGQAAAIGFGYVLESTIVVVCASEAIIERSVEKFVYTLEQSYSLFDAIVTSNTQPGPTIVDEEKIIKHELMQGEFRRIYRDCEEVASLKCNAEITPILSKFKQRAVQEAEEIQAFLSVKDWN
jgi:Protein of unknown function (DUF416)